MRKVLILGCGPSGLLAAHAAVKLGHLPIIVSVKRPSQLFGCQYLHSSIPDVTVHDPKIVNYELRGTAEEYAEKVYGPEEAMAASTVSPSTLPVQHFAWDIRSAYGQLWLKYSRNIRDVRVFARDIEPMIDYYQPDVTFSTIPAPLMCVDPMHNFRSTKCWAIGDAPEIGQKTREVAPPYTIVCDGTKDQGYYRASNVFGYQTVEWPGWRNRPPVSGVVDFLKPLATNCDCWPQVTRIGRMGKWRKGVLAHEAYEEVWKRLS